MGLGPFAIPLVLLAGCGQILDLQRGSAAPAEIGGGNYAVDPDHAVILWKIDHLGFSTYVGRIETFEANLDIDPASPEAAKIDVAIDLTTIDSGVEALDDQLKGTNFFDVANFPQARFTSTSIVQTSPQTANIQGDLTLKGETRPITLSATFDGAGTDFLRGNAEILGFSAKTTLDRTEFGIDYLAPAVGSTVDIEIFAEFVQR